MPIPTGMDAQRTQQAHDWAEEIREKVRAMEPKDRPEGLFQRCQDLVYLFRGRPTE